MRSPYLHSRSRGTRLQMANPHHLPTEIATELEARSRLPVDHPDYVPSESCAPKLLFPEARKRDAARRRAPAATVPEPSSPTPNAARRRAGSSSSDGSQKPGPSAAPAEDETVMAAAMVSRVAKRMRKGILADGEAPRTRPSSRGDSPRLPEKDRTDPVKRALGPYRPA